MNARTHTHLIQSFPFIQSSEIQQKRKKKKKKRTNERDDLEHRNSDWSKLGPVETWAARIMLPIPVMLNVYWMALIVSGALKFLTTGSEEGKPAADDKKKN